MIPDLLLKAEGAGNDFILGFGSWADRLEQDPAMVVRLCRRHVGIGADGILAVFPLDEEDGIRTVYRNADGSAARFCANGTRCAARAAVEILGLSPRLTVMTGWGPIPAVVKDTVVSLQLPPPDEAPRPIALSAAGRSWEGWLARVGVRHVVIPVEGLENLDVAGLGPLIRSHPDLGPGGANVNFVQPLTSEQLRVRSFETGVEAETLSCGSGVVASALAWLADHPAPVLHCSVRSGDELTVEPLGEAPNCPTRLTGPARILAELHLRADLTGE